jgi:two-component system phosphate regulon sensor histidine kinase PhoR
MSPLRRPLLGAAVAIGAILLGVAAGDALTSGLLGAVGGALGLLLGWPNALAPVEPPPGSEAAAAVDRRTADILDPLADPVLLVRERRIAIANRAARDLLGQWIEDQDVRLVLRQPEVLDRLAADLAEPASAEVAGLGDFERPWLITVAPVPGGDRLVHLSDRSEAAAAERMRVDFVANASHELRTPLAAILGLVETLQDEAAGADPALRQRFLGLMHGEARRMEQLIEDLMSLSRIEAERFSAPREAVDLLGLIDEVRTGCRQLLSERGNALVVNDRSSGTIVQGDRGQLLQLLRNLVVNAVKYGRGQAEVTIDFEDDGAEAIRMVVTDRGEGIPAEHLPRLTERFYRVDAGRSRALGGTGLGLAIVKHIVSRHRGRLDIRSTVGEGTSVLVSLPRFAEEPIGPLS